MKTNSCVQCGKVVPDAAGRCPACGGLTTTSGLWTTTEGMAAFNFRVEAEVNGRKEVGAKCLSVELDYLTSEDYQVVLGVFRRVAATAGIAFEKASDHYWIIQCWLAFDKGE